MLIRSEERELQGNGGIRTRRVSYQEVSIVDLPQLSRRRTNCQGPVEKHLLPTCLAFRENTSKSAHMSRSFVSGIQFGRCEKALANSLKVTISNSRVSRNVIMLLN